MAEIAQIFLTSPVEFMSGKRIYISVINDLVTDQRVQRIAETLSLSGDQPVLLGRKFKKSPSLKLKNIEYKRFRLLFNSGFVFYASFNFRLLVYLITRRDIALLVANDLDTLPANWIASKIKRKKLVYDSHEYFTEVPELIGRNFVKNFWIRLERFLVPKVDLAYTVNDTLAKMFSAKYGIAFHVIRNVPKPMKAVIDYKIPEKYSDKKLILYQGAVNRDRGLEEMIRIMPSFSDAVLVIAGEGDVLPDLKSLVEISELENQVLFTGRLCPQNLKSLTAKAHIGISLEKKTNLNYYYALPNKIFDYIHANVPLVCSSFPEMKRIIEDYNVGMTVDASEPKELEQTIRFALNNEQKRKEWIRNCTNAASTLSWENEQNILICIYQKVGLSFNDPKN